MVPVTGTGLTGRWGNCKGQWWYLGREEKGVHLHFLGIFFFFVIVVNVDLKCEFHQIHPSSLLTSGSQGPNSSENLLSGSYFTSRVPPLDFVIDQLS